MAWLRSPKQIGQADTHVQIPNQPTATRRRTFPHRWRHWGTRLGYTSEALADANRQAIGLLELVRNECETNQTQEVISGCVGPRGDGYVPHNAMSEQQAEAYHREQVDTFASSAADMVCAVTMNYVDEAVGIVRATQQADIPVAISFTVETDGNLPTGQPQGG